MMQLTAARARMLVETSPVSAIIADSTLSIEVEPRKPEDETQNPQRINSAIEKTDSSPQLS